MGYFICRRESAVAICNSHRRALQKKSKKKKEEETVNAETTSALRLFSYEELELATNGFSSGTLLGKGSHGSVYKAVLDNGRLPVAVKKPKARSSSLSSEDAENNNSSSSSSNNNGVNPCENEIEILSRIRDPCLVNLLGFTVGSNQKRLAVVEFMPNGTLYQLLHCNPSPPNWVKRLRFALQIATAILNLHSAKPPVIHRDIKSSNVLVDENWNARLGDFGLALCGEAEDVRSRSTPPAGTLGYLDPGYVTPQNLSAKSDVFSFGCLLLEMISGRNAIDVSYSPPSVVDWALPLIRRGEFGGGLYDPRIGPPRDPSFRRQLAVLAARCARAGAERRPSMQEVVDCLLILSKRIRSRIWNNFAVRTKKTHIPDELDVDANCSASNGSIEEEEFTPIPVRRNSVRNKKFPNVEFERNPAGLLVEGNGCRGCTDVTYLLSEMSLSSDSKQGNTAPAGVRSSICARSSGAKLRKSRSFGMSRTGRILHESNRVDRSLQVKYFPHRRGLDVTEKED